MAKVMVKGAAASRRNVWKLLAVVVGMFGFGFALVPMYNALCQLTNLNGKDTGLLAAADVVEKPDETRTVNVQFLTTVNGGRLYSFKPEQSSIDVHPGKLYTVYFTATNQQDEASVGQAVPSVVPWNAAKHLHKTECFCFNQQPFKANEEKHMPVRFMVDTSIPADVQTMTLSYTFFDVTQLARDAGKTSPSAPKS